MTTDTKGRYGGRSREDRIAERREKLMQAAATLYGRGGVAEASVTSVCAEAGLTPRYFYESFASREALLLAVFERVCDRVTAQVTAAIDPADPTVSGLTAFFRLLADHPQLARVFLIEIDPHDLAMRGVGRAMLDALADMIAPALPQPLARAGVTGAILRIARMWVEGGSAETVAELVTLTRPFVAAGSATCARP